MNANKHCFSNVRSTISLRQGVWKINTFFRESNVFSVPIKHSSWNPVSESRWFLPLYIHISINTAHFKFIRLVFKQINAFIVCVITSCEVDTNVLEEHTTFIFNSEDLEVKFLRTAGMYRRGYSPKEQNCHLYCWRISNLVP